jgi:hypothetical protein
MIRDNIISHLESVRSESGTLQQFFNCIEFEDDAVLHTSKMTTWFKGCIESLYYVPNRNCLILTGTQGIGKSELLRYLSPKRNWFGEFSSLTQAQQMSKDFFIVCVDGELEKYSKVKQMRSLCMSQEFVVLNEYTNYPMAEKRLASYCATLQEWTHPTAKSDFIIPIRSIDFGRMNKIDRNKMWSELHQSYKITKLIAHE